MGDLAESNEHSELSMADGIVVINKTHLESWDMLQTLDAWYKVYIDLPMFEFQ